jgi:ribonuclease VapC
MVLDTSAVVAILLGETQASRSIEAVAGAPVRLMSAFSVLETAVVISARKGAAGTREVDLFLHHGDVEVVPLDAALVALAREAYERFGKGRHPAGLNLGDCCSYALAAQSGHGLLFKGDDFARTDVKRALVPE